MNFYKKALFSFNFYFILIFLFFVSKTFIYAQQPAMWHITDEEGLPSLTVYDIFQDFKGFIWFGTEMGLFQFDGKNYKSFRPTTAHGRAMSYIQGDSEGNIWFANFSGQLFYIKDDIIYEADFIKELNIKNNFSYTIDHEDNLWIACEGLHKYSLKTKKNLGFKFKNAQKISNSEPIYFSFVETDFYRKGIWTIYNGGILFIQDNTQNYFELPQKIINFNLITVTPDNVFFTNRNKNKIYKKVGNSFKIFNCGTENKQILFGRCDKEGNFWICTFAGVYAFDKNLKPLHQDLCILPKISISDVFLDREGNTWISTLKNGVYVLPNKQVLHFNNTNTDLTENNINCMTTDEEGNLFLGLNNGKIAYFDTKKHKVLYHYDTHREKDIEALCYDRKTKKLYVGCTYTYIFNKNNPEPQFRCLGISPKSYTIFKNNIVSANSNEANVISIENNIFGREIPLKNFFNDKEISKKFPINAIINQEEKVEVNHVLHLRQNRSRAVWAEHNRFWVAYADGLFMYENGKETQVFTQENTPILARCFTQTQDSTLWIGTVEQGFFKFFEGKFQAQYTKKNLQNMPSDFVRCIGTDAKHIWLGTDKGIVYFEPKTLRTRLYDRQDGIMSNEITGIIVKSQQLWVTSMKGIFRLPLKQLLYNTNPPPIYITGLKIWENEVALKGEYILKHTENNLKIDFQALAYRSRGIFRYKYRMIGVDSAWIYTESANNFARYPSLLPGNYEFQVKAINEDDIESDTTALLQIEILFPFWQKWWFILGGILLFFGIIFYFYQAQISNLQKNSEIQKSLRESQLSALKVQMNPHFIFNALNSIQEFILLNEKRLANQFLGKFADLMRITLDMSNQKTVKLTDEIKLLNLYLELEKVRFEELQYYIELPENVNTDTLYIPPMLLQPYIENALKHGLLHKKTDRVLWIKFYFDERKKHVLCEIEDNGVGREKSAEYKRNRLNQHTSFATSATQKRLELLNYGRKDTIILQIKDLYTPTGEASGTRVLLEIPTS